jgi:hypothetical protein
MEDIDIWRAAEQMRKLYGPDAATHAAMRADKLMDQGNIEGTRVTAALNELDRPAPKDVRRRIRQRTRRAYGK